MEEYRKIRSVVTGTATQDGAGVKLTRVLGGPTVKDFDPFLMLDAFDSRNPEDYTRGFPPHPHRGIETVTYLISGEIEHGDGLGNKGTIRAGECQWMTAGSGIIHKEMPKASGHMLGAQLWINLPAKDKMKHPAYNSIPADAIPVIKENGATVKVIAGQYKGTPGAFQGKFVKTLYLDVILTPKTEWEFASVPEETLFAYTYDGEACFEKGAFAPVPAKRALLFEKGEKVFARAGAQGVKFLLLMARPLNEPVAWGGPIVMNTREELNQAIEELEKGTFVTSHQSKL